MPGFSGTALGAAGRRTAGVVPRTSGSAGPTTSRWSATDKAATGIAVIWDGLAFSQSLTANIRSLRGSKPASGRVYLEAAGLLGSTANIVNSNAFGIANAAFDLSANVAPGNDAAGNSIGYYPANGCYRISASSFLYFDPSNTPYLSAGGVFGMAVDAGASLVWFCIEGVWRGSGFNADPAKGVGGLQAPSGQLFPAAGSNGSPGFLLNTGSLPFRFPVPSGFQPWG